MDDRDGFEEICGTAVDWFERAMASEKIEQAVERWGGAYEGKARLRVQLAILAASLYVKVT